jgi:hypothetical protein
MRNKRIAAANAWQIKEAKKSQGRDRLIGLLHTESVGLGKNAQPARKYAYDYRKRGSVRGRREIDRLLGIFPVEKALTAIVR